MSDTMLLGVLRMPMDYLQPDLQLLQFIDRARQAADRIEADAARIAELEAELAAARAPVERQAPEGFHELIMWLLGENGEFPDRPERVEGKIYPYYWWRKELRQRYEALRAEGPSAQGRTEGGGYCADCNSWGGEHKDGCQRRPERFA